MALVEIEKGIPVPHRGNRKYPFDQMEVGDSFLLQGIKKQTAIGSSIAWRKARYGEDYVCRAVKDGLRVWRTR